MDEEVIQEETPIEENPQDTESSVDVSEVETTPFTTVYDRFLSKITDDMYVELTPEDTIRDLQSLLLEAIPGFEFPRCNISNYTITTEIKKRSDLTDNDFVIGVIWNELDELMDDLGNIQDGGAD